jgi:nitric oxide reductase activation protein
MRSLEDYGFLASAIAGRRVSVQVSTKPEALAFSDGRAIVMPAEANVCSQPAWMMIVAQAALIGAGSLDAVVLRQLLGRRNLVQRYLYLEVLRANFLLNDRLPWAFSQSAVLRDVPALSHSVAESLACAQSMQALPSTPDFFGTIRPWIALRAAVSDEGLGALTRRQQQGALKQREVAEHDEDEATEESQLLKLFQNPFSAGNPLSDMLNDILGAGISKSTQQAKQDGEGGAEMPIGRIERALRRGINALISKRSVDLPDHQWLAEAQTLKYPEWDSHAKAYRRDWVFLEEVDPWRAEGAQNLDDILTPPTRALRRQLATLGLDHEMHRRQGEGADLDIGALIDCAIDLQAGHSPPSPKVYRASRRTRRDLAVAIVLDISGSTGEQDASGKSAFKKQLQLAYQLSRTFDSLGDTLSLFGFHSWGRKLVRMVRIKGHGERWSGVIAERLALLEPVGYTRIGTAIRHGARLLHDEVRLPNRLLVLITDGIAYDQDYEHRYAEGDARKALQEAQAAGTACVCLSVGAGTEMQKLSEVFGAANILAVDEVAQITGRIREVCRKALASVAKRKLSRSLAGSDKARR